MKAALDAFTQFIYETEQTLTRPMNELIEFINTLSWSNNSWKEYCKENAEIQENETAGRGAVWTSKSVVGNVEVYLGVDITVDQGSFNEEHYLKVDENVTTACTYTLNIEMNSNRDWCHEFKTIQREFERGLHLKHKEDFEYAKEVLIKLQNALIDEAKETQPTAKEKKNFTFLGSTTHVAPLIYQLKDNPKKTLASRFSNLMEDAGYEYFSGGQYDCQWACWVHKDYVKAVKGQLLHYNNICENRIAKYLGVGTLPEWAIVDVSDLF